MPCVFHTAKARPPSCSGRDAMCAVMATARWPYSALSSKCQDLSLLCRHSIAFPLLCQVVRVERAHSAPGREDRQPRAGLRQAPAACTTHRHGACWHPLPRARGEGGRMRIDSSSWWRPKRKGSANGPAPLRCRLRFAARTAGAAFPRFALDAVSDRDVLSPPRTWPDVL
jgi:hypothetical protein